MYAEIFCPKQLNYEENKFFLCKTHPLYLQYESLAENIKLNFFNINDSFETVQKYVTLHGGKVVYGYVLLKSQVYLERENFAIWESPDGVLHHITKNYLSNILFSKHKNCYEQPYSTMGNYKNLYKIKSVDVLITARYELARLLDSINKKLNYEDLLDARHYKNCIWYVLSEIEKEINSNPELKEKIQLSCEDTKA